MSGVSFNDLLEYIHDTQDVLEVVKDRVPGDLVDEIEANMSQATQLLQRAGLDEYELQ